MGGVRPAGVEALMLELATQTPGALAAQTRANTERNGGQSPRLLRALRRARVQPRSAQQAGRSGRSIKFADTMVLLSTPQNETGPLIVRQAPMPCTAPPPTSPSTSGETHIRGANSTPSGRPPRKQRRIGGVRFTPFDKLGVNIISKSYSP